MVPPTLLGSVYWTFGIQSCHEYHDVHFELSRSLTHIWWKCHCDGDNFQQCSCPHICTKTKDRETKKRLILCSWWWLVFGECWYVPFVRHCSLSYNTHFITMLTSTYQEAISVKHPRSSNTSVVWNSFIWAMLV